MKLAMMWYNVVPGTTRDYWVKPVGDFPHYILFKALGTQYARAERISSRDKFADDPTSWGGAIFFYEDGIVLTIKGKQYIVKKTHVDFSRWVNTIKHEEKK